MDRTQEILELATKLVAMLLEDRSRMNREMEQLRAAVEKLQETMETMSVMQVTGTVAPEVHDESDPELEHGQVTEPESAKDEPEEVGESGSDDEDQDPKFEPMKSHEPELEFIYEPEPESEPEPKSEVEPETEVLRPRNREEQMKDTSEWGMFFNSDINVTFDDESESIIGNLMDFQEAPADPAWMTDIPGSHLDSVYDGLSNNDRVLFIRELFDEDGEQFSLSMDRIDEAPDFGQVVKEMRIAFPDWDESSDIVYQFYMLVRRRFN